MKEKIISEKIVFQGKKITVKTQKIELQNKKTVEWEIVEKGGNSVAVLPIDKFDNIYLIREYYGAANERLLSLPKGMPESNENYLEAGLRELQEEIGFKGILKPLMTTFVSPSYLRQKTIIFYATGLEKSILPRDDEEFMQVEIININQTIKMIKSGEISEARTVAAILFYFNIIHNK